MSKGTKRVTVRIDDDILDQVRELVISHNNHSPDEPWDLSDFIRVSIVEKIDLARRRRGKRGGVRHPPPRKVN